MMFTELDHGTRCSNHAGEVFPPRCRDCEAEARAADHVRDLPKMVAQTDKHGYCLTHRDYPSSERWPCARCVAERGPVTP